MKGDVLSFLQSFILKSSSYIVKYVYCNDNRFLWFLFVFCNIVVVTKV